MAGKTISDRLARGDISLTVLTGQTTSAVQGTQSSHAHGLKNAAGVGIVPAFAIPVPTATAVDHASTGLFTTTISVVSMDATNVVVRAGTASQTFTLLVG